MALRDRHRSRGRATGEEQPSADARTDEPRAASPSLAPEQPERQPRARRRLVVAAAVILILAAIGGGVLWWIETSGAVSTDDAFVDARIVQVSPQVSGTLVSVPVNDNQLVGKGSLLARIDPRNFEAALAQAKAQLEQARASLANSDAQIAAQQAKIAQAGAVIEQAQAALTFARQQNDRAQRLLQSGAGTQQQEQQAHAELINRGQALAGAQAAQTAADKQLAVLNAQKQSAQAEIAAAQAAVDKAQIDLDRTGIYAPTAGHVANLSAAVGTYATPGATLMSLVPTTVWVTANFKETELGKIHVGDPVDIAVDAYPGRVFKGHVASIQAGSGTAFSLLPAQNATGNYVKIVQRVPVKIVFDNPPEVYLGPGMSVVPSVKVQ